MHLKTLFYPLSLVAVLLVTNLHAQSSYWQPRSPFVIDQQHRNRDSLIQLYQTFFKASSAFDFNTTVDTCYQYIQRKDDAMAAIEAAGMDYNSVLLAEWDRLFNEKYLAFQDVISTHIADNDSLFTDKLQSQLARLDLVAQNFRYNVRKPAVQNDTTIRSYHIRAAVDKVWIYIFPATEQENMTRLVLIAQLRMIGKKPLITNPYDDDVSHLKYIHSIQPEYRTQVSLGGGLLNRTIDKQPGVPLSINTDNTYRVAIQVCVNPDGTVKSAEYSMRGSTTMNAELRFIALRAAKKMVFAPADKEECGTVTFTFMGR